MHDMMLKVASRQASPVVFAFGSEYPTFRISSERNRGMARAWWLPNFNVPSVEENGISPI